VGSGTLEGRKILVSGGTSGLGAAIVRAAAGAGAGVGVLGRRQELLDELVAETGAVAANCDVADADAVESVVPAIAARLGGLDGVVNCAAAMLQSRLTAAVHEDWERMLAVNVLGTMNVSVAAIPLLRDASHADLMIISSPAADRVAAVDFAMYSGSKAALTRLAEALHAEFEAEATAIRTTLVKPGLIDTDGVTANVRDPEVRRVLSERRKTEGLPPVMVADQIVQLLALPADVRVHEISLSRAPGRGRAPEPTA